MSDTLCVEPSAASDKPARQLCGRPLSDMPRERLLKGGASTLTDTDLIALILGTGQPGFNVFEVASGLHKRFGSMRAMLNATERDFDGLRGIGRARIAQLLAILEMARRALAEEMEERSLMDSPEAVEDYLRLMIGMRPCEVFACLYLDARHRLIHPEECTRGSLTRMAVYPREIARRALEINAASVIVAHNHPSGAVTPSASDRQLTRALRDTLALIDVQLIDHFVVGPRDTFSFARAGWP
ncbi:MAG TPA: DNA repair protein RadC [Paraburkholderia sp.]|nr:DNA repair protein RadC [Paraburkholderia sp.]